ncbi:MAG: NUDIX hydrolase [Actinomycetota bacterium]|nr:NUDIX hydrolase [Actinomycetota bacterium]
MATDPEILESSTAYEGKIFDVVVDRLRMPDGSESAYETVKHRGAVAVVPLASDGRILMVRQRRHAVGDHLLEIPAGKLEPDEDPRTCARRELEEETGFACAHLDLLVTYYSTPGFSNERVYVFVGHDLEQVAEPPTTDGAEAISMEWLDRQEAVTALLDGRVVDGKSIIGIALARLAEKDAEEAEVVGER